MAKLFLFYLIAHASLFMASLNLTTASRLLLPSNGFPDWVSASDRKLLQSPPTIRRPNLVVAQDGSGNYRTISEAVAASINLRNGSTIRFVIQVKAGVYSETVQITSSMTNLMMVGDGRKVTVVTGNKNFYDSRISTLEDTATFAIKGDGFIAQDMTFQNTAGRMKDQAVALVSQSNRSVFYRCSFEGYQNTLYVFSKVQFYRECFIYGTIDFIFGNAAAVFQHCHICVRKPRDGKMNTITAQGRYNSATPSGITIQDSVVEATSELKPVQAKFPTYLGRPWKNYSRTVFMNTYLNSLINSHGWLQWGNQDASKLPLYYGEYNNTGPGASTAGRVKWLGHHFLTMSDAEKFTVGKFLSGNMWIPATGIPYKSGL